MLANNETGVIQDIESISKLIKEKNEDIYFHTDAVQGAGKLDLDVSALGVDLLSISAHKFNGPKGIGALYIKKGTDIENILFGGAQERGLRPGTENIASIMGMSKALTLAKGTIEKRNNIIKTLEDYMVDQLKNRIEGIVFNGLTADRLPGYINIGLKDISNESLLMNLDMQKIYVSSGSACTSGSIEQSHVIKAMGLDETYAVLRFSLNEKNTKKEIDYVIEKLKLIINRLR
jgi:cysteine desulfurase